jgi:hypothetical protein
VNKFVSGSRPVAKDGITEPGGVAQDGQTQNGETQDLTASIRGDGISGSGAITAGPKSWGNFQLLQRLGQGGFGEVYRAWDPVLEREIAVKLLLPGDLDAEQELISAVSEARALARVRHPNIVSVYGVERRDGRVGFWSDYIRGRTLQSLVETEGRLEAQRVASLGASLCDALAAVHAAGLLHRDVKASNAGKIALRDAELHLVAGNDRLRRLQLQPHQPLGHVFESGNAAGGVVRCAQQRSRQPPVKQRRGKTELAVGLRARGNGQSRSRCLLDVCGV